MRTSGTFQRVYEAAKSYALGTAEDRCPINPVIRREEGKWMLESSLNPTDGDFEISLEAFDSWFWEGYKIPSYSPSDADITEFIEAHS